MPYTTKEYLNLITSQHKKRPKFLGYVKAIIEPIAELQTLLNEVKEGFSVHTAIGVQLDQVGEWVGVSRIIEEDLEGVYFEWDEDDDPSVVGWDLGYWQGKFDAATVMRSLDDETYRLVIYAKIMLNSWRGDRQGLIDAWNVLLSHYNIVLLVIDNCDLTMTFKLIDLAGNKVVESIIDSGKLPITPVGIGLIRETIDYKIFAFNTEETGVYGGFGTGGFVE